LSTPFDIRSQFLAFFRERGHTVVPSAPVVPHGDPTLLFTNAGMNQFKDVFLEQGSRPYTRVVDSQKCIRVSGKHNDLEEVGPSPYHHTFFEMLGNWSFGDYYKREAIRWAWELLTGVWKLDPKRLYATIFEGEGEVPPDDEARQAWLEDTGIAPERISLHSRKDNFWEMGEVGPCGPCSEIHYDLGPAFCRQKGETGHRCVVNGGCGRIVELWNLVFIQYRRDEAGKLHPLPHRHVDTGAGFERILMALEGVRSNYETSVFAPIVAYLAHISGTPYYPDQRGIPHRVATDHVRMLAFALADGVLPSNDGRGYVLRRVLRRAARYGREIGLESPFLYKLVDPLTAVMGNAYPELKERHRHIVGVIKAEEESFARTLGRGLELFGSVVEKIDHQDTKTLSGDDAFKLYDTYGFPLDLTELMARERNLSVDTRRFDELMTEQRIRARGEGKFTTASEEIAAGLKSEFVGYTDHEINATLLSVNRQDDVVELILNITPFYAEAGGQISDHGWIEWGGGSLEITDVARIGDSVAHRGKLTGELPSVGDTVSAHIDWHLRLPTEYNHTATHLLHTALRKHLGQHASQAGSLVAPDRLRFDFTHFEKIEPVELDKIERTVNEAIRANYEVRWYELPYKEAIASGIIALFGEKYGEVVRVVQIGEDAKPYSRELCGGCHVRRTGELGFFRIVSEGAVSAGVRRIEAVTGEAALDLTLSEHNRLTSVADLLGSHGSDPVEKLRKTLDEKRALEKEVERLLGVWAKQTAADLLHLAGMVNGVKVIAQNFTDLEIDRLKLLGDAIRAADSRAVALLASPALNGSGQLCCVVGDALIAEGKLKAGELVSRATKVAGGGGGGRPHMATAGTKQPEKLGLAVAEFPRLVQEALRG
jgi:alanyl-tRNA synthetase